MQGQVELDPITFHSQVNSHLGLVARQLGHELEDLVLVTQSQELVFKCGLFTFAFGLLDGPEPRRLFDVLGVGAIRDGEREVPTGVVPESFHLLMTGQSPIGP